MIELINGGIYKTKTRSDVCLIFIGHNDKSERLWGMLTIHRSMKKGFSAPMFYTKKNSNIAYTEKELEENHGLNNWILLDGRLRIEKIDWEMSFVDYPIGQLEPLDKIIEEL